MSQIVEEWGGKIFFDGAHQVGLIAGGQFQDPLREGAAVLTGSAGKTFSGPQSGMIAWDDPELTVPITHAIFPVLAATHQVNRVAALAVAAAEMLEFGQVYMAQIVKNARALAAALDRRGIPMLGKHKGYTRTHQVIADVRQFGGGLDGGAPAGPREHHHQQEPAARRPARGLGSPQRPAHRHNRGDAPGYARGRDGYDRRLHSPDAGRPQGPRRSGGRRHRVPAALPDAYYCFEHGLPPVRA